jgi:uncharacterized protein
MILVDANLLIYAVNRESRIGKQRLGSKRWFQGRKPLDSLGSFRWRSCGTTRSGLFRKPLAVAAAFDLVDEWLRQPSVTVPEPTPRHLQTLRDLVLPLGTAGNLTSDAHLAALAIEHGAELCSADNDFARFDRLRWRNPLAQ